jgi:hypothetical protein
MLVGRGQGPSGQKASADWISDFELRISDFGFLFQSAFRNQQSAIRWPPFHEMEAPHGFCAEGPCPRAWHPIEGYLSPVPISIRFERFTVFHTSGSAGSHDFVLHLLPIRFVI